MRTVSWTQFRDQLTRHWDDVAATGAPLRVTRRGHRAMVLLPADEFTSLQETVHLLRSPANAQRLFDALARAEARADTRAAPPTAGRTRPPVSDS